jgi:hypothetical protein
MRLRPLRLCTLVAIVPVIAVFGCSSDDPIEPGSTPAPVWSEITNLLPATTFYALWAPRADLAIGVGKAGSVWQWDGQRWSQRVNPCPENLFVIDGGTTGTVIMAGDRGTVLQQVSGSLVPRDAPTTQNLRGAWRSASDRFVIVGEYGVILRGSGNLWSIDSTGTTASLFSVWGTNENDVFAVGVGGTILHGDGVTWEPMNSGTTEILAAVSGTSASDVYAAGAAGTILHYDGVAWSPVESPTTELLQSICADCGPAAVGVNGTVVRLVGDTWQRELMSGAPWLYDVERAGDRLVAVGAHAVLTHDGVAWSSQAQGTIPLFRAMASSSESGLVVAGDNGVVMLGGPAHWSFEDAGALQRLNAVWVSPSGEMFAAGTNRVLHREPTGWVEENNNIIEHYDIGGNDLHTFVVGSGGSIRRRSGDTWAGIHLTWPNGIPLDLHTVNLSASEGFAAGKGGTILRFDGTNWGFMTSHSGATLWDIVPVNHELWRAVAVGSSGVCLGLSKSDGEWTEMASPVTSSLYSLATGPDGNLFAVGAFGTVIRYLDNRWWIVPVPASQSFTRAWSYGGALYACGGSVTSGGMLFRYGPPDP